MNKQSLLESGLGGGRRDEWLCNRGYCFQTATLLSRMLVFLLVAGDRKSALGIVKAAGGRGLEARSTGQEDGGRCPGVHSFRCFERAVG